MPAPFPRPRQGTPIANRPTGFPLFFSSRQPRVVTADPWSFLRHVAVAALPSRHERRALAYIDQAFDFFAAARNPQVGSKPLLYYYSFLNLVKAALVIRSVNLPVAPRHGLQDPRANTRQRLRLEGQTVRMNPAAGDRSELFAEFVRMLGGRSSKARNLRVIDLLAQIPSIHRTYCRVARLEPLLLPLSAVELFRDNTHVWARVTLNRSDKDVRVTLPGLRGRQAFSRVLHQVVSPEDSDLWFETAPVPGRRKGIDNAIRTLSARFRLAGTSTVLTSQGYRYYLPGLEPRKLLPPLAAVFAAVFYLGSITRYKPDVFDKITAGGYSWVIAELIATQPTQFLYHLASELAGVDVVLPYASVQ